MTSVFYEDIKLSDASIVSIEKCESLANDKERKDLDKKRKALLSRVADTKSKQGQHSAYQR
jgi:hypothetical protein